MKKIYLLVCSAMLIIVPIFSLATAVMQIEPSTTSITIRSDGEGVVLYTVTNNTDQTLTDMTITPSYLSTANGLSVINNNCTSALAASASCTFKVSIPGANQPVDFSLLPRVCAYNDSVCSKPLSASSVSVRDEVITTPVRAYFNIINGGDADKIKAITISDDTVTTGNGSYSFAGGGTGGAVSTDGKTLYFSNKDSNPGTMAITDVSIATPAAPSTVTLENTNLGPTGLALSSNESFAFVTGLNSNDLYKVDLSDNTVDEVALGAGKGPHGVAISPDGSRAYVANLDNTVSVVNTATDALVTTITNVGQAGGADLLDCYVTPDGSKLFVTIGDGTAAQSGLAVIATATNTLERRVAATANLNASLRPEAIAVSPDGNTLYITEFSADQVVSVDLDNSDAVSVLASNPNVDAPTGVAITPDGTTLYVSNEAINSATKIVLSPLAVSLIALGGGQTVFGNFIG